jgi:hypothetical protein
VALPAAPAGKPAAKPAGTGTTTVKENKPSFNSTAYYIVAEGRPTPLKVRLSVFDDRNQPVGKNVAIWMSEDARHLPVKLQADLPVGSFNLLLREAK